MSGASGTTESGCETGPIVRDYRSMALDSQLSRPLVRNVAGEVGQGGWRHTGLGPVKLILMA